MSLRIFCYQCFYIRRTKDRCMDCAEAKVRFETRNPK